MDMGFGLALCGAGRQAVSDAGVSAAWLHFILSEGIGGGIATIGTNLSRQFSSSM
jgi:hypothetical protein